MSSFRVIDCSTLRDVMVDPLVFVSPDASLQTVIVQMGDPHARSAVLCRIDPLPLVTPLLARHNALVESPSEWGIVTESDLVQWVATGTDFEHVPIADCMTVPTVTQAWIDDVDGIMLWEKMRCHGIDYLPILDDRDGATWVGIATPSCLCRLLQPTLLLRLKRVRDVMTEPVIHAFAHTSLLELAQQMAQHRVNYVVIVAPRLSNLSHLSASSSARQPLLPIGIITASQIIQAQILKQDLSQVQAQFVMVQPVITLQPEDSLCVAHERMQQVECSGEPSIELLIVLNPSGELAGVVTPTHLLSVFNSTELCQTIELLQQQLESKPAEPEAQTHQNQSLNQHKPELEGFQDHHPDHRPDHRPEVDSRAAPQSSEHLRIALEVTQMGTWEMDWGTGQQSWSAESLTLFGYAPDSREASILSFLQRVHPEDLNLVQQASQRVTQTGIYQVEYRVILPDQTIRWLSSSGRLICDAAGEPVRLLGIDVDISARKQIESQLKSSLQEKEILLKEIHHRVKNNLQLISSLMRMQSRRCADPHTAILLQESQNRVQSMALIHEQLYQSPDISQIDFGQYIWPLIKFLFQSYGVSADLINVTVYTQGVYFSLNQTILCGLIAHELISNSLKHAFPTARKGEISICVTPKQFGKTTKVRFNINDNGVGIPDTLDWRAKPSLGLRIVQSLVTQLGGSIQLDRTRGTAFYITFTYSPSAQALSQIL